MRKVFLYSLVLSLLLGGCAAPVTRPEVSPAVAWERHRAALLQVTGWHLSGRIAIRTESEGGQGSLDWQQQVDRYTIRITGPFGSGAVRLTGNEAGARLLRAEGEVVAAGDPTELLYEQTGWWIPVDALRHWVLGLPSPDWPAEQTLDQWGRLASLQQAGWTVRFLDYAQREDLELPARIFVSSPGAEVRLVVRRWDVNSASVVSGGSRALDG